MAKEVKPIKTERIDNPDGTYTVKEFYEKSLTIAVYDNNDKLLSNEWYKDYNCQDYIGKFWREYDKDNSYIEYVTYKEPLINNHSILSEIKQIDADSKMTTSKIYSDKNFKKLIGSAKFEYQDDGSFIQYSIYEQPQEHLKYLSTINYSNKDRTIIESKLYSDKNYKKLVATEKRKYSENFTQYESNIVYEKPYIDIYFNDNYYSSRTIANTNGREQIYYYKDRIYSILAKEYNYNEDGSYIIKKIYEKPNDKNCLSMIFYFNNENLLTKCIGYSDNNSQNIIFNNNRTYISPNIKIDKTTFCEEQDGGYYSYYSHISKYKNDKLISTKYYEDKEFKQLKETEHVIYKRNGYIRKTVLEAPISGTYSCISHYNSKKQQIKSLFYKDKNYKKLHRTTYIKYIRNKERILLREFCNTQNGIISEIEKFDNNEKSIYKKQYKFKGILAHILFWLAR